MANHRFSRLCACAALIFAGASAFASESDEFDEKAAEERVRSRLTAIGVKSAERPLAASTGGFGASLVAEFPSSRNRELTDALAGVVIAAPLSGTAAEGDGADSFGVRAALALADRIARQGTPIPVRIAFLADERSSLPPDLRGKTKLGLRDLADSLSDAERTAFLYLKLDRTPSVPVLEHGTAGSIAPRYLVSALREAFAGSGYSLPPAVPYNELYRLGLVKGTEELLILRERGIPAAVLTDSRRRAPPKATQEGVSAEQIAEALYAAIVALSAVYPEPDERYSLISFASVSLVLSEGAAVVTFIAVASLFLLSFLVYSLTHRHLLVARWNVFLRRSWVILGFLVLLFVCVHAAGSIISFILWAADAPAASSPYGAAALKLFLAGALYYALTPLFSFRLVPRRAHFYGSAAVFCIAIGALTAAVMDFTFVPAFIWAFAFAFLSVSISSPAVTVLPAVFAPLQIIGAAGAAVGSGDAGTALAVLSGGPLIELYLAFIALPFLFLLRRVSILSRARALKRTGILSARSYRRYTRPILLAGILSAATVFAFNAAQASREIPRPVREEKENGSKFSIRLSESTFLDRRTALVRFAAEGAPIRIELSLLSKGHLTIYEAPCPFVLSDEGTTAHFELGGRPPNPLQLEITLPTALYGTFEARAVYYDPTADHAVSYRAEAPVGTAPVR